MYIEVRKAGFVNKGAELMLHAVMQELGGKLHDAKLVMAPGGRAGDRPYIKRARLGFYQKAWFSVFGVQAGNLAALLPEVFRSMYGVVLDREVDIVLDIAGYSYGENAGKGALQELARSSRRWRRNSTKVILLPQAFGPFVSAESRRLIGDIAENVDLIFARDSVSLEYLVHAVGAQEKIRLAPDFTNLIAGTDCPRDDSEKCRVCVIPNYRMIDRTSPEISGNYMAFMSRVLRELSRREVELFFLLHEGMDDLGLCRELSRCCGDVPIVVESDALKIKGIIGACDGVIGSRYHGLVSALSQGVPALATGWSHKYEELFRDYEFEDGILTVDSSDARINLALDKLTIRGERARISSVLTGNSERLRMQSRKMWEQVFDVICN